MVPNYYVKLENIPLTSNGKVDRKGLPNPEGTGLKQGEYVSPRTEIEKKLVKIWSEVLGIEEDTLSIKADFLDLGGHSIKAMKLMIMLSKKFGLKSDISFIFANPCMEQMANTIESLNKQTKLFEHSIRL
jgi:acyl carrier protein